MPPCQQSQAGPGNSQIAAMIAALMQSRQTIFPKRLVSPGPDTAQLAICGHCPRILCRLFLPPGPLSLAFDLQSPTLFNPFS